MRDKSMDAIDVVNAPRRTRAETASFVIEQIRRMGLPHNPSARLMEMCRVWNSGHVPYGHADSSKALEAMRDIQQLGFVFDQMPEHLAKPRFKELVALALQDSTLPQDNLEHSPGRDAQFELYLGAICQRAGLFPVEFEEPPDVTCTVEGKKFGIAAKRLKSDASLREHVRKAANQIKSTGCSGVIALELSLAWNRGNTPIVSQLESQFYPLIAESKGNALFDRRHQDIYRWVANSGTVAVVLFDFRCRVLDGKWDHAGMMNWLETHHDEARAKQEFMAFSRRFVKGFPKLVDHVIEDEAVTRVR